MNRQYVTIMRTVEAMQYTGKNLAELQEWAQGNVEWIAPDDRGDDPDCSVQLLSSAHNNWIPVRAGDYVVHKGSMWMRVNKDTFESSYEPAKTAHIQRAPAVVS